MADTPSNSGQNNTTDTSSSDTTILPTDGSNDLSLNISLDQILTNLPIGSISRSIGNSLYGLNMRGTLPLLPMNKDRYGYIFFTRPQLNMHELNINNHRAFYALLTDNPVSYQYYIRMMLDPRLAINNGLYSPFVDNLNPFIPVLTNTAVSMSGWPDITVPTYTSDAGNYGQEYSYTDGTINHYETFDLDVSLRNMRGSPLIYLFYVWLTYQSMVNEGILNPYPDMITENEIDYMTRIYRIVTDSTNRYVRFIACTGASFPLNTPTGSIFDYNIDTPYNMQNKEINIRFRCMGFRALEDIVKLEFNETLGIFNQDLRKLVEHDIDPNTPDEAKARDDDSLLYKAPGSNYIKIPYSLAQTAFDSVADSKFFNLNYRAYPYINLQTSELEWWVDQKLFGSIPTS